MHICPNCGTGFQDDEEFCLDCGLKLSTDLYESDPTPPTEPAGLMASGADGGGATPAGAPSAGVQTSGKKAPGRRSAKRPATEPAPAPSPRQRTSPALDPGTDRQLRYRPVYKAPDEWTAVTIKELLSSAGLKAHVLPILEPFEDGIDRMIEGYWGKVLVLESDLEEACRLIGDYLRGLDRSMH